MFWFLIVIYFAEISYKIDEIPGTCKFKSPNTDYSNYDHDTISDMKNKEVCLKSCVERSKLSQDVTGCMFEEHFTNIRKKCIFIKSGLIVEPEYTSETTELDTCWKFSLSRKNHLSLIVSSSILKASFYKYLCRYFNCRVFCGCTLSSRTIVLWWTMQR